MYADKERRNDLRDRALHTPHLRMIALASDGKIPIDHMDTAVAYKLFGPPSLGGREKKSFGALRESQGERIRSQFYSLQFPFMLSLVEACRFFLTKGEKTAGQNLGGRGLNIRKLLPTGKDDVLSQWSQFVFQREGKASRNSPLF